METLEELPQLQPFQQLSSHQQAKPRPIRKSKARHHQSIQEPPPVEPFVTSIPFKVETLQFPEIRAHLICECIAQTLFMYQQIPMIWARLKEWADSEIEQIEANKKDGRRVKPPKQCIKQLLKMTSTVEELFSAIHDIFGQNSTIYEGSRDIIAVSLVFGQTLGLPQWTMILKFCGSCSFDIEMKRMDLKSKSANMFRKKMVEESLRQKSSSDKRIKPTSLHVLFCYKQPSMDNVTDNTELSERSITPQRRLAAQVPLARVPSVVLEAVGEVDPRSHLKKKRGLKKTSAWPTCPWIVQIGNQFSEEQSPQGETKRARKSETSPQWSEVREHLDDSDDSDFDGSPPIGEGGGVEPLAALAPFCANSPSQHYLTPSNAKYRWLYFHKLVVKGLSVS